jgi:uncharacterized protein YndB with AHSA1/START domain
VTEAYGEIRHDGDRCAVRFERLYDATADELWRALTDPAQLPGWLGDVTHWQLEVGATYELDVGGPTTGRIRAIESGRVLELDWNWDDEPESIVRFEIVPREHGVLLVLDHRRLPVEAGPGYGAGWHAHLDALARPFTLTVDDWTARYRERLSEYKQRHFCLVTPS